MNRLPGSLTRAAAGAALLLLLLVAPIHATTVVALDDGALARGARTILHGDVVGRQSFVVPDGGRIYTEYRFAVRELLKGDVGPDGTVVFREWGGEAQGIHYVIPGVHGYDVGEEVVAFLGHPDARTGVGFTYGLAQGKFTVRRDGKGGKPVVTRDLGGLDVVGPAGEAPPKVDSRDLEGFKTWIRSEVTK